MTAYPQKLDREVQAGRVKLARFEPRLSLHLINFAAESHSGGWEHLAALARAADVAGIDRVTVSDHVVYGEQLEDYANPALGGRVGGRQPTGPDGQWLDPLTTLSWVAGQTRHVRLGTQILLAALRRPVVLAKASATLDVLSGGRLDLGVGVGWQKAEYDAAGLSFAGRGKLLEHTLDVCTTLWRETSASFASPDLSFSDIHQMPKPLQAGGVPIWTSGTLRDTTVRRLLRYGLRWIAWGKDDDAMSESLPRIKEQLAAAGADPAMLQASGPLPIVWTPEHQIDVPRTMERVPPLVDAGQTDFSFAFAAAPSEAENTDTLRTIAEAFRLVAGRAPN